MWSPEGYFAASPGGERLMGWHVNNGLDDAARFFPAAQFRKKLYRPEIIKHIAGRQLDEAVQLAGEEKSENTVIADVILPSCRSRPRTVRPTSSRIPRIAIRAVARQVGENPITSLQLYLDGRPVVEPSGRLAIKETRAEIRHEFRLPLVPGRSYQVAVRADSPVSYALSQAVEITCSAPTTFPSTSSAPRCTSWRWASRNTPIRTSS